MSDLHAACSRGDVEKVLELLRGGTKTSCVNVRMETPLHVACALSRGRTEEKMEIVKQLLLHDAPLQEEDARGQTPLMLACETASVDVVVVLLDNGANVRKRYRDGRTMLHAAVAGGNARVLDLLLARDSIDINARDSIGSTPLMPTACYSRLDIVRLCMQLEASMANLAMTKTGETPLMMALEAGADPNVAEAKSGETPLMMAVREGKEAAVQMLLSHGADANAANLYRHTSLYRAACSGRLYIMHLLLEAGADPNVDETKSRVRLLVMAVREGEEAMVRMLLSHGADANAADSYRQTSLLIVARSGQLDIMRMLLEAGADPNVAETKSGVTPLMMASRNGKEAMARMLLSHGADANAAESHGLTSLHIAVRSGQLDIMRLLLEAAAKPNVADTMSGTTPLLMAVSNGEEAMVRMLLSHGADANAAGLYGQTSLHQAACSGQLDTVRMLLEAGADPSVAATEKMGSFTALHYSCDRLQTEMIALLLKHGADPNLVDCNKMMPLAIIGSEAEVRSLGERVALAAPAEQAGSVVQAASALLQTCESAGVLLQVNTRDSVGDTPLHSFCRAMLACKDDVYVRERDGWVQIVHALLFNHGAHVDVVNARGETPYELWRRIYLTRFHCNMQSSDEIHGRMSAQYHSLECHCARVIVRHSVAYENRLPPSLIEFVRAHARPT
ncbi:PREDICTED: ankyrin-1-like [Priapulus caudatus]|uniref:Ankyrin-1-like n=1 Tax=Priapulus caudatus TaxID=37621 RepID=A0ABM1EW10_PRICU|nr:PREDICTED: ankyrin-1-like [Priapulus caudatus]